MTDDFDDLDRAILALPLAEPPAGLRAAILRATIRAEHAPVVAFARREIAFFGAALAFVVWLALYAIASPSLVTALVNEVGGLSHVFVDSQGLGWLAAGCAVALVCNNVQLLPPFRSSGRRRA